MNYYCSKYVSYERKIELAIFGPIESDDASGVTLSDVMNDNRYSHRDV